MNARAVAHVFRAWQQATPQEKALGARWYLDAHNYARTLASIHGRSVSDVAAIIAALSPSVSWEANARGAAELLDTGDIARYGGYKANLRKALRIIAGETPDAVLGGFKVRAFWALIRDGGNHTDICIDTHAANLAAGKTQGSHEVAIRVDTYRQYEDVARAYRAVAWRVRKAPHVVQATCWLVQKRRVVARERAA
jgi:hypothetical protein